MNLERLFVSSGDKNTRLFAHAELNVATYTQGVHCDWRNPILVPAAFASMNQLTVSASGKLFYDPQNAWFSLSRYVASVWIALDNTAIMGNDEILFVVAKKTDLGGHAEFQCAYRQMDRCRFSGLREDVVKRYGCYFAKTTVSKFAAFN